MSFANFKKYYEYVERANKRAGFINGAETTVRFADTDRFKKHLDEMRDWNSKFNHGVKFSEEGLKECAINSYLGEMLIDYDGGDTEEVDLSDSDDDNH